MENILKVEENSLVNKNSYDVLKTTLKILDSKQAHDILTIKVDEKTIIADYFVICTAYSTTQLDTLSYELEDKLRFAGLDYIKIEGNDSGEWRIVDCKDVIVHIFSREAREFYKLDRLWSDCEKIDVDKLIEE